MGKFGCFNSNLCRVVGVLFDELIQKCLDDTSVCPLSLDFFVQAVFAIKYVEVWDLNLSSATMWVLGGGSILFVVVSFSTQWTRRFTVVINKKRENLGQNNSSALIKNRNESKINSLKLFLFAAFQIGHDYVDYSLFKRIVW